jgi:hypothetical protein
MFIYLKANLFNDLFYVLKEILNLAICCYNILVMEFLGCFIYSGRQGYKLVQGESTSRVRLGILYTVRDMYSFLSEYFSSIVLVFHAIRCRAAQVG